MCMYSVRLPMFLAYPYVCILLGYLCSWLIHMYMYLVMPALFLAYTCIMYLVRLLILLAYAYVCILLCQLCSRLIHVYVYC